MLDLADKYRRDVDEVHKIFFEVSCDRDRLVRILEAGGSSGLGRERWQLLEDLALKDGPEVEAYKYVTDTKGPAEVEKRRRFLEISQN
jgi:hypothetical protein